MTLSYSSTKEKLPGSFSYCLQRSDLDQALVNSVELEVAVSFVRFRRRNLLDPEFWRTPVYGNCPVLSLYHRAPAWRSTALSRHDPRGAASWHLYIYAVPRELRRHIRECCTREHLPALNAWLSESRTDTWHETKHRKTAFFDPSTQMVTLLDEDDY